MAMKMLVSLWCAVLTPWAVGGCYHLLQRVLKVDTLASKEHLEWRQKHLQQGVTLRLARW